MKITTRSCVTLWSFVFFFSRCSASRTDSFTLALLKLFCCSSFWFTALLLLFLLLLLLLLLLFLLLLFSFVLLLILFSRAVVIIVVGMTWFSAVVFPVTIDDWGSREIFLLVDGSGLFLSSKLFRV